MTEIGKKHLVDVEGCRTKPYPDSAGLPTIGIGHLLTKDELASGKIWIDGKLLDYRNGLTEEQCVQLMEADLGKTEKGFRKYLKPEIAEKLTPHQLDALASFAFNIGAEAFRKSTLLKKLNAGFLADVPDEMRRWIYSAGKIVDGLKNRREAEAALWNS